MSGLVVVIEQRPSAAADVAETIAARLAHRGPPEWWRCGAVSLGALGQGASIAAGVCAPSCVAMGRLDNARELAEVLELPTAASVAEVALAAYRRYGFAGLERLRGRYALAIHDGTRIALARDPLGVDPLYFSWDAGRLVVASEPRALATRMVANVDAIARFVCNEYGEDDETFFEGVQAVPPGAVLICDLTRRNVRIASQWRPPIGASIRFVRELDYADAFRESLLRAVGVRMLSTPVGVLTSGGLDSTAVAAQAAAHSSSSLVLTMTFPGRACDETAHTRALAAFLGVESIERDPEAEPEYLEPQRSARRDVYFYPTIASFEQLLVTASQRGLRGLLTGFGGDQVISRHLRADVATELRHGRFADAARAAFVPWWGVRGTARALLRGVADRVGATLGREAAAPRAPRWMTMRARRAVAETPRVLPSADSTPQIEAWRSVLAPETRLSLVRLERLSAHVGVSVDHPFFDQRLVELLLAFPAEISAGRASAPRKPLHRRAFSGRLPPSILSRTDVTNFNDFIERLYGRWQLTHLRAIASAGSHLAAAGIVEPRMLQRALESREVSLFTLGALVAAESWLESIIGGGDERRSE